MKRMISHILNRIHSLPARCEPHFIAIDGRCASGKSTLAKALAKVIDCPLIHMDDFFLPSELRTKARLSLAGENIHHERLLEEVFLPLSKGLPATYRPYDCHTNTFRTPLTIEPKPVILVEGSYACHSAFFSMYSLRIFLSVDPEEQFTRIKKRNGKENLARFREHFIPMEEQYFSVFDIPTRCDISLDTKEISL